MHAVNTKVRKSPLIVDTSTLSPSVGMENRFEGAKRRHLPVPVAVHRFMTTQSGRDRSVPVKWVESRMQVR